MLKKLKYSIYPLARYSVNSSCDLCPAQEGLPSSEMIGNSVFMLPQSRDPPESVELPHSHLRPTQPAVSLPETPAPPGSRACWSRVSLLSLPPPQVVTAMGKTWHPEHFVCTHCQEEIGSRNFFERDGQPYCEKDYHNLFSPRCYYCNGPILDVSLWGAV